MADWVFNIAQEMPAVKYICQSMLQGNAQKIQQYTRNPQIFVTHTFDIHQSFISYATE